MYSYRAAATACCALVTVSLATRKLGTCVGRLTGAAPGADVRLAGLSTTTASYLSSKLPLTEEPLLSDMT